ncbi:MAG: hypothetical protein IPI64_02800 [Chloracidobacterium sp.]|nr:hypothetical protein [Chloracidobacterium sp.]
MNLLAIALLLSCLPTALIDFALPKWKADKNVRIDDAYKWTYQATRGGEHAVPDADSARKWLDNEWSSMGTVAKDIAVWQPLCPGSEIGRLNLRPFKTKGGEPDDLLDAFLASSREYRSDGTNFVQAWNELGRRLKKKSYGSLTYKDWSKLDAELKVKNYPAIHHSDTYENAEQPAYRILTFTEHKKLLATFK